MAGTKPVPAKPAAAAKPGRKGAAPVPPPKPGPAASMTAVDETTRERLAVAKGMPGWKAARKLLGDALAAGDTAILLEARDKAVSLRRRSGSGWQPAAPLVGDDPTAVCAALVKLVAAQGTPDDPGFVVAARKQPRRECRVEARKATRGDQVLVLFGPALPPPVRPRIGRIVGAALGRLVPPFLKRTPPPERDPTLPAVDLVATGPDAAPRTAAAEESDGYVPVCDLVAAAVRDRANAIAIEGGPRGVTVRFDVDGVAGPAPGVAAGDVAAMVGALRAVAGIDPKARGPQSGRVTAQVQGKSWPCTVAARRGAAGERIEVVIDHVRPKFKTLADTGVSAAIAGRVQELLKLEGGLILIAGPHGGGLSTLCDTVITVADRLLRDFVLLEDEAAPRPEIQNVKPSRWDSRAEGKPVAALQAAMREYPSVLVTHDLADADLAKGLIAQAAEGRLVIAGIRAADAAEGIAQLAALGVDRHVLARVLLGAVGVQLVRKLCPKCRQEYFPSAKRMEELKLDPDAHVTLFRAAPAGCPVCTGTGYLGRAAVAELAEGPTLRESVARGDDAAKLRQAAAKDGMTSLVRDALAKAAAGVTSVDEVARVFRRA